MRTRDFALAVLTAALIVLLIPLPGRAINIGDKAPDFQLENAASGSPIKLSNYLDKPTVLVFWTSWCPHCRNELPVLESLYGEMGGKVNFVGISLDDDPGSAAKEISGAGITFPNAFADDQKNRLVSDYSVMGVPAIFILDKSGTIKYKRAGEISKSELRDEINTLGS